MALVILVNARDQILEAEDKDKQYIVGEWKELKPISFGYGFHLGLVATSNELVRLLLSSIMNTLVNSITILQQLVDSFK